MKKKIVISSDCVCDLSKETCSSLGVKLIYFYIKTDRGCFKDRDEVTAQNVFEYFDNGGEYLKTQAPEADEYEGYFERVLETCEEIIHISIGSELSQSYASATKAKEKFAGKITVFDSKQLSTGMGHLVIRAAELAREGKERYEIISELESMRDTVSISFIAENTDYLYKTGKISKFVKGMCSLLKLHPVLAVRNGQLCLAGIQFGNYEKSVMRYIKGQLRDCKNIDTQRVFITHASCMLKILSRAKVQTAKMCNFKEKIVTDASATVSSNCGPNALGIAFVRK